jgi:hypothetical protein
MTPLDSEVAAEPKPSGSKALLLTLATASALLIVAFSAWLMLDGLRHQRKLQALAIAVLAVMAITLWLRVVRTRWMMLRMHAYAPPANEETGVWGVGGPGMRTPGATGIYPAMRAGGSIDPPNDNHGA